MKQMNEKMNKHHRNKHYLHLLLMSALSFIAMYILMYAMVNSFSNLYLNFNQFYMAGLMLAPMILLEILFTKTMYQNTRLNILFIGTSAIILIGFFLFLRSQTFITDKQFLKSMIPHHAGAILMCQQAQIKDPEIEDLCKEIITSQEREINQMKAKLEDFKR